jgi:uncharacterized protein (TIGR00730 family)
MVARWLGSTLARRGIRLVYGGASVGMMGTLADAVLAEGGEVIGVIPGALIDREVAHPGLTHQHVVATMHERKARMAELAEAFIALPGGLGTLEELFEVWTWGLLGIHSKPFGILDVHEYFAPLVVFLDAAVREGFVRDVHRAMVLVDTDPDRLIERMLHHHPPPQPRVIGRGES